MFWKLPNEFDVLYRFLNLPVRERLDPLLLAIIDPAISGSQTVYCYLQLAIFTLGVFCLLHRAGQRPIDALISSAVVLLGIITVVRLDPFYLKFHWFPFLVFGLDAARAERRFPADRGIVKIILAAVPIYMWCVTAGSLGVAGALLAPVVRRAVFVDRSRSGAYYPFVVVSAAALSLAWMPIYRMPPFPGDARLAPVSPLTQLGHPAVGPDLHPLPLLYPNYLAELTFSRLRVEGLLFGYLAVFLLFAAIPRIFGIFPQVRKLRIGRLVLNNGGWPKVLGLPLAVLGLTWLMLYASQPAAAAKNIPDLFFAIRDLIPGLALEPLPWLIVPFGVVTASLVVVVRSGNEHRVPIIAMLSVTLIATSYATVWFGDRLYDDHFTELQDLKKFGPSGYVGSVYGNWIFSGQAAPQAANLTRYSIGSDVNIKVDASINPEDAQLAIDKNYSTRWATKRPQQPGDWITFAFDRPLALKRLTLSIRNNSTDFPRGLRVEGSPDGADFKVIYQFQEWLGPVEWTENGHPYFGLQSRVVVDLPETTELRAVRFTQTGSDPSFDWSVGELLLWRTSGNTDSSAAEDGRSDKEMDR